MSRVQQTAVLPVLAIPVLHTPDLARTLAHYRQVLGFQLAQQVPGVVALLRHGPLQLQLWQCAGLSGPQTCRIALDGGPADVFGIHQRLAASARACLDGAPCLRPWGAWEFSLTDGEGNRLMFVQWVVGSPLAEAPVASGEGGAAPGNDRRRSDNDRRRSAP